MSLKKDTIWNLVGSILPIGFALFSIPIIIKSIGNEGFSIISLVWALVGYFGIFDFGVGRALTYELSKTPKESHSDFIRKGFFLALLMGVVSFLFVYFIISPNAYSWFGIKSIPPEEIKGVFEFVSLMILPATITSAVRGVLEGSNRFKESNYIKLLLGIVSFAFPIVGMILFQENLWGAVLGIGVGRFLILFISLYFVFKDLFGPYFDDLGKYKTIFSYGGWVTLSGIVSPLMVYGDRFFVSAAVGAEKLPFYAVPQEGLQRLLIFSVALTSALLPRMVTLSHQELGQTYKKNLLYISVFMGVICSASALIVPIFLKYWISQEFSDMSKGVVYLLIFGIWFNALAQMPYALLNAKGLPKNVALIHVFEIFIYGSLIYYLSSSYGILGAAAAWSIRALIDFLLLSIAAKKNILGV